ncbi:NAD(P)H-dependent glycerol-3-phosphate dehydrogenase [Mesomycoplasma neurolyticum]|uniref:Glycerol-3-phosphate dehydrogenase n=1 Tax=Mesomycoplasma neurolyticum TaxID=2120 RepID=A0A449A4G7_9BACT|nr:NAD(P)H-dependent glycerol-3-phosphate dehydrogenase [Mesomycoplasma neurolyticum]VEU59151.1 glycerol-3-phosphate dehydrogenase [Mesomycoplasma neurolyticum]
MENKFAIIGSGAMATAMAKVIYDSGYKNIIVYGINEKELADLNKGQNLKYFPKERNIPHLNTTLDLNKAITYANYIVLALPSKIIDVVFEKILTEITKPTVIINCSKGFYPNKNISLQQGLKEKSKENKNIISVVSLLGPSHAEEIVREQFTIVTLVSDNLEESKKLQPFFNNKYFKTYLQSDEIGAEVGSVYKNILAIASGMMFAAGYGINTIAAFLTRGFAEAKKFNEFLGGKNKTLMGLTGMGDLIVTALSPLSRNYTFGYEFIKNQLTIEENKTTVEGLTGINVVKKIADHNNLSLPIVFALYEIIYLKTPISEIIEKIWNRPLKEE